MKGVGFGFRVLWVSGPQFAAPTSFPQSFPSSNPTNTNLFQWNERLLSGVREGNGKLQKSIGRVSPAVFISTHRLPRQHSPLLIPVPAVSSGVQTSSSRRMFIFVFFIALKPRVE